MHDPVRRMGLCADRRCARCRRLSALRVRQAIEAAKHRDLPLDAHSAGGQAHHRSAGLMQPPSAIAMADAIPLPTNTFSSFRAFVGVGNGRMMMWSSSVLVA